MNVTREFTNLDRAEGALVALAARNELLPDAIRWKVEADWRASASEGSVGRFERLSPVEKVEVLECALRDLLTNAQHLADMAGLDWAVLIAEARNEHDQEADEDA